MWEYMKVEIESLDIEPKDIVEEMDKLGADGWEVFSLTEWETKRDRYGDIERTTHYKLYMKKRVE